MSQKNFMYDKKPRKNSFIYIAFLILSFVWLELYPSTLSFVFSFEYGYGDVFANANLSAALSTVFVNAIISWLSFEILFWIYRYVLSFKIYSFVVPMDSLKAETRMYFIFRNIILGLICNLCFLFPYLYIYEPFFDLLITMIVMVFYAKHLNNIYSDSIVGHFVFKNFCYPIFIYELIEIICGVWVVLLWRK